MGWRLDARGIVRRYPAYSEKLKDLHGSSMTANYNGMPGGGDASRSTENIALRTLPKNEQMEYDAVDFAIRKTVLDCRDAGDRLKLIGALYWSKNTQHTIEGAAMLIPVSEKTARTWNTAFLTLVDAYMTLMNARF